MLRYLCIILICFMSTGCYTSNRKMDAALRNNVIRFKDEHGRFPKNRVEIRSYEKDRDLTRSSDFYKSIFVKSDDGQTLVLDTYTKFQCLIFRSHSRKWIRTQKESAKHQEPQKPEVSPPTEDPTP